MWYPDGWGAPDFSEHFITFFITVLLFLLFAATTRVNNSFSDALAFGSFWGGLYFSLTSDLFISLDYVE